LEKDPIEASGMNSKPKTTFALLFKSLEIFVVFFTFALVNINSLIRFRQFPEVDNYSDNEGSYVFVAILVVLTIIFLLWRNRLLGAYFAAWKQNKLLIAFLIYASISLLWSVYIPATFYKLIFLFFSTIAGSYLAIRYKLSGVINVLTWVGAILCLLSILLVAFFPLVGVMQNRLFFGSWTGIFWHRNDTGNIFAYFSILFLLRFLFDVSLNGRQKIIIGLLYLMFTIIVFGSRSATGYIILLTLHVIIALIFIWLKFRHRIKLWHYYLSATVLLTGLLIFIANRGFFFGLLGRSADMTGRVPVWEDLLNRVYLQKPLLGYGYGALWMQKSFRIMMQIRHHWGNQLYFADNGFVDLLLNTGIIGLLLFLAIYIPAVFRSFRQAITTKSWLYFFPFVTFLYIFVGNLTYSFLLEVDQLVWMLLVIMVFLTTSPRSNNIPQP
jgi:exopolysaccharide production protein ExoQ